MMTGVTGENGRASAELGAKEQVASTEVAAVAAKAAKAAKAKESRKATAASVVAAQTAVDGRNTKGDVRIVGGAGQLATSDCCVCCGRGRL